MHFSVGYENYSRIASDGLGLGLLGLTLANPNSPNSPNPNPSDAIQN